MLPSNKPSTSLENANDIVKQGTLRKLKTMKKKYFVLKGDSPESSACLEYYENEKKFRTNCPPRRVIHLKSCFNINRLSDKKHKFIIGLFYRMGCFCIGFDTEQEREEWLEALLRLQHGENLPVGEPVKPFFEHVWNVEVLSREMGSKMGILGPYHVCLTSQVLSLIKATPDDSLSKIDFSLEKLRAYGHMHTFFYLQVGKDTVTGAGNLWMTTGDTTIAQSMHTTIMKACKRCHKDLQPKFRIRSISANESSKPVHIIQRWPTHTGEYVSSSRNVSSLRPSERRHSVAAGVGNVGVVAVCHQRTYSFPLSQGTTTHSEDPTNSCLTQVRDKYDSMPCSRARTTSEGNHHPYNRSRPHSIYIKANSPPVHPSPLSPMLGTCSTDSAGSSMSMDGEGDWDENTGSRFHSLTPDEPVIEEENADEYPPWPHVEDEKLNNYMHMGSTNSVTNTIYRKISPAPHNQGLKSSSPSQGSLADVYSPVSSPPLENQSGYMPMSPVDVRVAPFLGVHSHSRDSSIDDLGYMTCMPMHHHTTAHSDDGYVDMDQKNNRERYQSCGNTSGGSSCSLTSGTPSGDLTKYSECSLDRVSSGIGPEELRPARAYSVGSRPQPSSINKSEMMGAGEEKRVRAFSVGSHYQGARIMASIGRMAGSLRGHPNPSNLPTQSLSLSHSSVEPADDLMELDFTKRAKHIKNMKAAKKPSSAEKLSDSGLSPPKPHRLVAALFGRSPPKMPVSPPQSHPSPSLDRVPETEPGYLEMTVQRNDAYMEMKPVVAPVKQALKPQSFPKITSHQGSTGGCQQPPIKPALFSSKPSPECYVDMNLKRKTSLVEDNNNSKMVISQNQVQTNNGYVEMQIKTSSPLPQKQESNYMNMEGSNKAEKRHNRKDRRFSQPIKIQAKEVARKTTPLLLPLGSGSSTNGLASSADSNRSVDSNRLEQSSNDSKNGSLESHIFNTNKSPCNACDYVMFQVPCSAGSKSDPMSDYTMMGPPSLPVPRAGDTVDILRTGLGNLTILSDTDNMSRHSEDEPTTDSSKSLSRASSTASVGEKEVEYASLDLRPDDDRLAAPPPQPHSYAKIDFNFESNKLKN